MTESELTDVELQSLEELLAAGSPGPWTALVEGRDHDFGDDFIMVGSLGGGEEDMYVSRDTRPVSTADLDLIAQTRTLLPRLIGEIRRCREGE